jgi:predicted TPR repeat methyltransferase
LGGYKGWMNPVDVKPLLHQVQALIRGNDQQQALGLLGDGLKLSPESRDLLYARAHLYIALTRPDEAAADLDRLLVLHPDDVSALDDRGVLFQWQGDYMQAAGLHLRAAEMQGDNDGILLNLAIALSHLGQRKQAEALYQDVLRLNPKNARALVNLGVMADERSQYEEAENYLSRAHALGDISFELCMGMGNVCRHMDRMEEAASWYGRAVAQQPNNPSAQFMLAAMRGDKPPAPPPEHVAGLFDSYADTFETSLVDKLQYDTPNALYKMIAPALENLQATYGPLNVMDLGAGTGLFGKLIRPHAGQSFGVDLSPKMLEKAKEQNIYDHVIVGDIADVLAQAANDTLHLVSAADVFVYVGALETIFALSADKLASGGLFAFTTEAMEEGEEPPFALRDTGRYAHDKNYLEKLTARHGFKAVKFEKQFLRQNKNKPLDGYYVVLQKP